MACNISREADQSQCWSYQTPLPFAFNRNYNLLSFWRKATWATWQSEIFLTCDICHLSLLYPFAGSEQVSTKKWAWQTMQIVSALESWGSKLGIIFLGGKTQVSTNKKMAWNKDVYFQYFQCLGRYNFINSVGRKYSYLLQVTLEIRTFLNMRLKCWKK